MQCFMTSVATGKWFAHMHANVVLQILTTCNSGTALHTMYAGDVTIYNLSVTQIGL